MLFDNLKPLLLASSLQLGAHLPAKLRALSDGYTKATEACNIAACTTDSTVRTLSGRSHIYAKSKSRFNRSRSIVLPELVDAATQWTEIVPLADTSAKTTALAIQHHGIARHGMPTYLHSDLESCFTSQLFQEICNIYNIDHTFASSQNHRSVSRTRRRHSQNYAVRFTQNM